ncbi:MAG TPA: hypothetical protein VNY27_03260 [Solirubrobacteraceae bacterium]|jgi:hypothetical protein|nr:hypothetical protein [Solirubrobacteraceae bacterium]
MTHTPNSWDRLGVARARFPRPRALLTLGGLFAVLAGTLLLATGALAVEERPPRFQQTTIFKIAYSTRATVGVVFEEGSPSATVRKAEYAPAEASGEPPPESSPAWVAVPYVSAGGEIFIGEENASGGNTGAIRNTYLRHLAPGTSYYARFTLENTVGRAVEKIPFKTLPLQKPEVAGNYGVNGTDGRPWFFGGASATKASFQVEVESNGSETTYNVEYSLPENGHAPAPNSASWKPFTSGGSGTIATAQEYAWVQANVTGLAPETVYYVRLRASNAQGQLLQTTYSQGSVQASTFTTLQGKPYAGSPEARNVTASSAFLTAIPVSHGSKTAWRLESATSESGPWTAIPAGAGTISQAVAESTPYGNGEVVGVRLAELRPSTVYYVRVFLENECAAGCGPATSAVTSFQTSGAPTPTVFPTHALHGESLRLLGWVNPNSPPTSAEQSVAIAGAPTGGTFKLTFKGQTTANLPYNASSEDVFQALRSLSSGEGQRVAQVFGLAGGPYTVLFGGPEAGKAEPLIEGDGSGLTPSGTVTVATTQPGGEAYDTHYRFQYVSDRSFAEHGWEGAAETPEVDAGSGNTPYNVGFDLPALSLGETYRYRMVAHNTAPGTGLVDSAEYSLTVPVTAAGSTAGGACPNEAFRTGLSAHLPDCRAYELITPADKGGAQEPFHYGEGVQTGAWSGEDGEHLVIESAETHWGAGLSPYLFSRGASGWSMTSGSPEPETGIFTTTPLAYSSDLTKVAFRSDYDTTFNVKSPLKEYKLGPVGGPYTTVASVSRQIEPGNSAEDRASGWVAANRDLSALVLATQDRTLLGEPTGTRKGFDLYEYTAARGLRQLNVAGKANATIGSCGASVGQSVGSQSRNPGGTAGQQGVSADGSRIFFEAAPGNDCAEPSHLYMRVRGETTVDIGAYRFLSANSQGTKVLLAKGAEAFLYDSEAGTTKHLFDGVSAPPAANTIVSSDFTVIYTTLGGGLYRYDLSTGAFSFVMTIGELHDRNFKSTSPDGRYYYYQGSVAGLPGEGVMRYDSVENVVECISCASPFDPEPTLPAFLQSADTNPYSDLGPQFIPFSANGDFAFFSTPAALVPQDTNGEIAPRGEGEFFDQNITTSPSSDIYEWRRDGVNGCVRLQGCLALITDGRTGFRNLLLGTANNGRDVFIYTRSRLLPQDVDTAFDVYDARIGGGFAPPPPRPVECEGDACSVPPSPPNDATPSSSTFTGAGNLVQPLAPPPAVR